MTRTVQDLADYLAWQVQIGHGKWDVRLCPRGLSYLRPAVDKVVALDVPQDGETCDDANKIVFVRAVF